MTDIDFFFMLSCVFGGALFLLLSAMLLVPSERPDGTPEFLPAERLGMGIMGGAALMLLPGLYLQAPTVFTPWATTVFWAGALVFFVARAYRAYRHRWGNWMQGRYRP